MKTAIITGVMGQDGRFLAKFLLEKNYRVVGLISPDRQAQDPDWARNYAEVELVNVDFANIASLENAILELHPSELYNLAAASSVKYSFEHPLETAEITALMPLRILEVLRKNPSLNKTRLYQASSSEMFGNGSRGAKNENSELSPASPYAASKVFAHQACQMYKSAYGLFISCGILFNHESSLRSEEFVSRKITRDVARIVVGKKKKMVLGSLYPQRDWGFAGDYVEAMWKMLQYESAENFVVASGKPHSVFEFAATAIRAAGLKGDPMDYIETDSNFERPIEIDAIWGDPSKANRILGWQPKVSFEVLIDRMVSFDIDLEYKSLH